MLVASYDLQCNISKPLQHRNGTNVYFIL